MCGPIELFLTLIGAAATALFGIGKHPTPGGNHFYFLQRFFAFLLDRAASGRVPKQIFCAKKPGTNAFPVKAALPARGANRVTRFLKMSGVTPCRVGRLTRSAAILAVFLA